MGPTRPIVLFLCVHNAGRSQMAAAWLRQLAGDAAEVYSAGSQPAETVNPAAVAAMAEAGIDIASTAPRVWTESQIKRANVVITMGCGDECPLYPSKRYEDWDVADPAGRPQEEVAAIRDDIRERVVALMASLELAPTN